MDNFWKEAVKVTGPVAVISFVISLLIERVYREEIMSLFGSDIMFYLTMMIIAVLAIGLILSLFVFRVHSQSKNNDSDSKDIRHASIKDSKIEGDVVLGDKTINQDCKRGK